MKAGRPKHRATHEPTYHDRVGQFRTPCYQNQAAVPPSQLCPQDLDAYVQMRDSCGSWNRSLEEQQIALDLYGYVHRNEVLP